MHNRIFTFSNLLTATRIVLTPFLGYALFYAYWSVALGIFLLACVTDFFDGYLARTYAMHTTIGSYLDPIADKFLVAACCIALALRPTTSGLSLPGWFVWLVLFRESIILFGAIILKLYDRSFSITPTFMGKSAIAGYALLIGVVVFSRITSIIVCSNLFFFLVAVVTSIALFSFGQYLYRVARFLG